MKIVFMILNEIIIIVMIQQIITSLIFCTLSCYLASTSITAQLPITIWMNQILVDECINAAPSFPSRNSNPDIQYNNYDDIPSDTDSYCSRVSKYFYVIRVGRTLMFSPASPISSSNILTARKNCMDYACIFCICLYNNYDMNGPFSK